MADSLTPNYSLTVPEIGGSNDSWGDKLNDNFVTIDTVVKSVSNAAAAAQATASAAMPKTGGMFTGSVGAATGSAKAVLQPTGDITADRGDGTGVINFGNSGSRYLFYDGTQYILPGAELYINGNRAWHTGNQGPNSGLNADLLDGFHATSFLRRETNTWVTSAEGTQRFYFGNAGTTFFGCGPGGWKFQYGSDVVNIGTDGVITAQGSIRAGFGSAHAVMSANGDITANRGDGTGAIILGPGGRHLHFDGSNYNLGGGYVDLWCGGAKFWNSTNHGPGSGLNADLLDGMDSSAFARVVASSSAANGGYRIWSDGYKECWGDMNVGGNAAATIGYPITFSSWARCQVNGGNASSGQQDNPPFTYNFGLGSCTVYNAIDNTVNIQWKAHGY